MPSPPPSGSARGKLLPVAAVVAVGLVVLAMRCARPAEDVGTGPNVGAVSVSSKPTAIEGLGQVSYRVTGNEIAPLSGSGAIVDGVAAFVVKDIPAGTGYVITLTANAKGGLTRCQQRATFDIVAERITPLQIGLPCANTGGFRRSESTPGGPDTTPARQAEVSPACTACEEDNIKSGKCEPDAGCDGLEGTDKALCLDLVACARATACWVKRPLDCLCGTAGGVACAQGEANGDCRREIQAATKTMDPIKNGTLFYNPDLPAGRAMRLIACDYDNCQSVCGPN